MSDGGGQRDPATEAEEGTEPNGSAETDGSTATKPQQELTPEQYGDKYEAQQTEDAIDARAAYGVSDASARVQELMDSLPFGGGPSSGGLFGRTDFDKPGIRLNDMLDLVESAKPSDLEHAGDALAKARDKLNEAAEELDQYVTKVDWQGQGAEEFRRFGRALAQHAWSIGTFANSAGAQMQTASTGLASVRGAMPPRDGRLDQRRPEDFPVVAQVEDNKEYQAAVKVEGDRQEAITQMNRLASFYAVSEEMLSGQDVPMFPEGLRAAVPRPRAGWDAPDAGGGSPATAGSASATAAERTVTPTSTGSTAAGVAPAATPSRDVSLAIDSVASPPTPITATGPVLPPSAPAPTGPATGPVPPFASGPTSPAQRGKGGPTPPKGTSRQAGPIGRPGVTGTNGPTTGRSPGIAGRNLPSATGSSTPGRTTPVGRPGIVGGTPTPRPTGTTGQTGPVGRASNGIVGGSPHRAGTTPTRVPRGTVVGGDPNVAGRSPAGRSVQPGVVGPNSGTTQRPVGRGTPGSNGVVGAPRSSAPGRRTGGAFTQGGAGLAGARTGQRRPNEEEQSESRRPDYLTEDEETWTARRNGAVPPVIDQ